MSEGRGHAVVVGGGTMGAGIAAMLLANDWSVDIVTRPGSPKPGLVDACRQALATMKSTAGTERLTVRAALAEADWANTDLVIESVTEDLQLKQLIFAELERLAPAGCPITSNSSSFPISVIGEGLNSQFRMLGLHFFMPAQLIPLVEVISSERTDPDVAEHVGDIMWSLGKRPVQVRKDVVGAIGNRVQHAMLREALWLIENGVASAEDIDDAVRLSFGFRLAAAGPIRQKEHSGWNTTLAVSTSLWPDLVDADGPPPVLKDMVQSGRLGFRTKGGFFDWDDESIAAERERYQRAIDRCLDIFREEGLI